MVHDDGAGFVVDFGVDAGVADEVDDPFLAFVVAEAEAGGEVSVDFVSKRNGVLEGVGEGLTLCRFVGGSCSSFLR